MSPPLLAAERPAGGEPDGLLVLHHGRGADEHDLIALADLLDPARRLHVLAPRAPLRLPGAPGYHWYVVERVGFPDPRTFRDSLASLGAWHGALAERTGIGPERTVVGGFSQGAVMSYALALGADRPVPAGLLALSGFIPQVDGWEPSIDDRTRLPVFAAHGRRDPVIDVAFGRRAGVRLRDGGIEPTYVEFDGGHEIAPGELRAAVSWLDGVVSVMRGTAD